MSQAAISNSGVNRLVGRSFVNPVFDYMIIGGGLSIVATVVLLGWPSTQNEISRNAFATVLLLSNMAHFAASTVRLYTKRGTADALPFLTMAFPMVCLGVIAICLVWPWQLGMHLQSLYLTWSPYHYAAQAYGLAVMYAYRTGCLLTKNDKRLLFWIAMIPFFRMFFCIPDTVMGADIGSSWLFPAAISDWLTPYQGNLDSALLILACTAPIALCVKIWMSPSGPLPLISLLMLVTNTVWFFALEPAGAFLLATVFHGLQYLAIVIIFHVKDRMAETDNQHGILYHVLFFYGACVLLAYALFMCLPWAYRAVGFDVDQSAWVVIAVINIHHFIVDGYIWRLKKSDTNRKVVDAGLVTSS